MPKVTNSRQIRKTHTSWVHVSFLLIFSILESQTSHLFREFLQSHGVQIKLIQTPLKYFHPSRVAIYDEINRTISLGINEFPILEYLQININVKIAALISFVYFEWDLGVQMLGKNNRGLIANVPLHFLHSILKAHFECANIETLI